MKNFEKNGKNESIFDLKDKNNAYEIAGPTVDNITLVRLKNELGTFEKFLIGHSLEGQPYIVSGKLSEATFPAHSVLAYGKTCAMVLDADNMCKFFDTENQTFVPSKYMSMAEVNENNMDYIQNAMFSACSGLDELSHYISENGTAKSEEDKMFMLELLNNVSQIVTDKTFKKIRNQIFGETPAKKEEKLDTFYYNKDENQQE